MGSVCWTSPVLIDQSVRFPFRPFCFSFFSSTTIVARQQLFIIPTSHHTRRTFPSMQYPLVHLATPPFDFRMKGVRFGRAMYEQKSLSLNIFFISYFFLYHQTIKSSFIFTRTNLRRGSRQRQRGQTQKQGRHVLGIYATQSRTGTH